MEPRKKSTVTVLYSYSYSTSSGDIQVTEGERLILIEKSNKEWWQVRRPGDRSQPFYAPANYLHEDGKHRKATKSDESLLTGPFSKATGKWSARLVNAELKKSTSMDAVMFLDMLENEAKQEVKLKSESLADKFKKPRISKDLWERRKSWAVEEAAPITNKRDKRHSIAPPLPPRQLNSGVGDKRDVSDSKLRRDKTEKAPALPPKRSGASSPAKSSSPDHYSRVIAVKSAAAMAHGGGGAGVGAGGSGRLTDSLERLVEQIGGPPLSYPHPVAPPRREGKTDKAVRQDATTAAITTTSSSPKGAAAIMSGTTVVVVNDSPPKLPPKMAKGAPPVPYPRVGSQLVHRPTPLKDNYVNLLRPVTIVDSLDDIQSDESGINMSFNNPLFTEREDTSTPADHDQEERSSSFNELDSSSIDERLRLNGSSPSRIGGSESNLSGELDVTYDASSSGEDLLSSKDSINSIPSYKSEQRNVTGSLTKKPPDSPPLDERAQRELFEGWYEYRDRSSGRPFYYNRETRSKSWKPPRKRGPSPMIRGLSIEEEPAKEVGGAKNNTVPIPVRRESSGGDGGGASTEEPPLSSSADSLGRQYSTDDDVDAASSRSSSSLLVHQRRRVVAEAVRSKKLPPAPPGWQEILEGDEVVYVNSKTKARWYTSLDAEGRIYFYEEDSNESLWTLPNIATDPEPEDVSSSAAAAAAAAKAAKEREEQEIRELREEELDWPTELKITPTVYYPEGSLAPEMDKNTARTTPTTPATTATTTTSASGWMRSRTSKADRAAKSRSMVLTNFAGRVEDAPLETAVSKMAAGAVGVGPGVGSDVAAKTSSLPRNIQQPQWPTLQGGSIRVLKQGILQKTKLTENGKKVRKSWSSSWVVLTDLFLFLFKESASKASLSTSPSGTTLESASGKVELCVDLNGATIEWAAVKSSRKGVFQVSTLLGVQLLLQDEDETNAVVWFNEIKKAIGRLPHSGSLQAESMARQYQPVNVSKFKKSPLTKSRSSFVSSSPTSDKRGLDRLTPPSPTDSFNANFSSKKLNKLQRTKSTKVPFLGSTEDLTAPNPDRQVKLRDKLRKFFVRRPPVDTLVKKGIYKDEPVFGCYLSDLCAFDKSPVPRFVQRVIQLIESKPENMKADGIYRASGNLSQIQKLRCHVDQYKWAILETEEDVHALTGCLKLFFRELKEPLIPFPLIEQALKAALYQGPQSERVRRYREVIDALPLENYETLKYLLGHLLNITEYREHNRMQISNLAIVFGPTIMWTAIASNNLALDMMQQNIVVEALLNHYKEIFVR